MTVERETLAAIAEQVGTAPHDCVVTACEDGSWLTECLCGWRYEGTSPGITWEAASKHGGAAR